MPGLSDTLANLTGRLAGLGVQSERQTGRTETEAFGTNPGALRMLSHVPAALPRGAPLVVVLHGCGQTAAAIDQGTGWSTLAERHGFVVLLPEQRRANNAGGCFSWFQPEDIVRGGGEAASIAAMVRHMIDTHGLDPRRVYVTGLSAGGAMANVLLAAYPDLFAGGAIIAGLPYGAARTMQSALELMRRGQSRSDQDWGSLVRAAGHSGRWPRVSVWQGLADTTVAPSNATDIVRQWLDVHGLPYAGMAREQVGPADHLSWPGADGKPAVELYTLPALPHGVPISTTDPHEEHRCGAAASYIIESGISSSYLIARGWGLTSRHRVAPPVLPVAGKATMSIAETVQKALQAAGLRVTR